MAEPVDLPELLKSCLADQVPIAESRGVDLGITTMERAYILGAHNELKNLFANLIDNAVRYTPPGGAVDVSIRPCGERAVVKIADTGCGIPEDLLPRVFDRFFRAAPPGIEGSGLGLSIVKSIADRHDLEVEFGHATEAACRYRFGLAFRPSVRIPHSLLSLLSHCSKGRASVPMSVAACDSSVRRRSDERFLSLFHAKEPSDSIKPTLPIATNERANPRRNVATIMSHRWIPWRETLLRHISPYHREGRTKPTALLRGTTKKSFIASSPYRGVAPATLIGTEARPLEQ